MLRSGTGEKTLREIYLIRHGRPVFEGNVKRCIGQTECPLSLLGKQEILKVREYLAHKNITKIYSSPLQRCQESARLIAGDQVPIVYQEGLREIHMGDWENKTFEEIKEQYPDEYRKRGRDFAHFAPKNGESFAACLDRGKKVFRHLVQDSTGNIAVIGHGGLNRVLLCWLLKADLNTLFQIKQPYGCINLLREEDGQVYVNQVGCLIRDNPGPF
ncbi:histidine phosphatase family protein [Candidatus Formimonas warabiya]|uniref:Histidine phosphatase family protein n=1 Tax=Formimonas warabiya TaxID=1761012 RepID=A0A3G1KTF5_FORW1|nr:histidine phosphatase family protein [Candidatus Formimonas warabiya]ATW25748.1 hypothetical protein DCMF_14130 [Candidatus Formimonas warabiya]